MTTPLSTALTGYSLRLDAAFAPAAGRRVISPIGIWLLIALAGPAARPTQRRRMETVLGMPVDAAANHAVALLRNPHPSVAAAVAAWSHALTPELAAWTDDLPDAVQTGPVPAQREVDAWAAHVTNGLIDRFPVGIGGAVLVLASAIACDVRWLGHFTRIPSTELGPASPWVRRVNGVLRSAAGHECRIVDTLHAGRVAMHAVTGRAADQQHGGLRVVSVIAEPDVPPADVRTAATELAISSVAGAPIDAVSLWDLPLGDGTAWTVTEREQPGLRPDARPENLDARLPAWSSTAEYNLLADDRTGFGLAADALTGLLPRLDNGYDIDARQVATARYQPRGFKASAVTALRTAPTGGRQRPTAACTARHATLRFARPYAVTAVADHHHGPTAPTSPGPWHGLPIFTAWVAEPAEVEQT